MSESKRFSIEKVIPGMFVTEVVSQGSTVKVKAGGMVRDKQLIDKMRKQGVIYAYVDMQRSDLPEEKSEARQEQTQAKDEVPKRERIKRTSTKDEMGKAERLHENAKKLQKNILNEVKGGGSVELAPVEDTVNNVMESVFRNPNAMLFMTRVKQKDDYLFEHATNVAALMASFASQLQFSEQEIQQISIGAFLQDIGMILIDDEILAKTGPLTEQEKKKVEKHVTYTEKILERVPKMSDLSMEVATQHHERLNGSGYPSASTGAKISQVGRMAAIVDSYDAMLSDRPYRKSITSTRAFQTLLKDAKRYDPDLVQQFIKFIGVHPVGSMVKLKSGKLGVIYQENIKEPLKPIVACFYNSKQRMHMALKMINLAAPLIDDEIEKAIKPEEFRIDLNRFMRDVLMS